MRLRCEFESIDQSIVLALQITFLYAVCYAQFFLPILFRHCHCIILQYTCLLFYAIKILTSTGLVLFVSIFFLKEEIAASILRKS